MADNKEKDAFSGVETTGHEWDGLKELNNPAPRWWLWVFFVTVVWSIGYWFLYPAWPTLAGNTKGSKGWTQYTKLAEEQAEITAIRGEFSEKIRSASLETIQRDPDLYSFAIAGGRTYFKENCAACHGTGGEGAKGYPNLNDDDWLWGGDVASIYKTLRHGIRSGHDEARTSQMPSFEGTLKPGELDTVAEYVLSLSGQSKATTEGMKLYQQNCAACHGENGRGGRDQGAPNLADAIWFYGSTKQSIVQQMKKPRHGVMPAWEARLPDEVLKQLTVYVHSLGGGEPAK